MRVLFSSDSSDKRGNRVTPPENPTSLRPLRHQPASVLEGDAERVGGKAARIVAEVCTLTFPYMRRRKKFSIFVRRNCQKQFKESFGNFGFSALF